MHCSQCNQYVDPASMELAEVVLHIIHILEAVVSDQSHLDVEVAQLQQVAVNLTNSRDAIQAEIDALKAANPGVDFSALDTAVSGVSTAADAVAALAPATG